MTMMRMIMKITVAAMMPIATMATKNNISNDN